MFEITVKVQHECPYLDMANVFKETVYSFCSALYDLFVVPREITHQELNQLKQHISDLDSLEIISAGDLTGSTYLYFRCMCMVDTSITPKIEMQGGIVQEPHIYEDGWEIYKVLCINEKTQASVLEYIQTIPKYEIVSIKDLGRDGIFRSQFVSMHQMVSILTDRQIEVLVNAHRSGYYEIPRNTTTQQLADEFGVSRAATEKSLRKAENSVMNMIIPYMILHQRIHNNQSETIKPIKLFE